jgi:hypothetical protein
MHLAEENQRREGNAQDRRPHYCDLTAAQVAQTCYRLIGLDAHDLLPITLTAQAPSLACSNWDTARCNPKYSGRTISISLYL